MKTHVSPLSCLSGDDWLAHEVAVVSWGRAGYGDDYLWHLQRARARIAVLRAAGVSPRASNMENGRVPMPAPRQVENERPAWVPVGLLLVGVLATAWVAWLCWH